MHGKRWQQAGLGLALSVGAVALALALNEPDVLRRLRSALPRGFGPAPAATPIQQAALPEPDALFDLPARVGELWQVRLALGDALRNRNDHEALRLADTAARLSRFSATDHYNLACVLARIGLVEPALARLDRAVFLGFDDEAHLLADPDLRALHVHPGFHRLLGRNAPLPSPTGDAPTAAQAGVAPAPVRGGNAPVDDSNTVWDFEATVFRSYFEFPPAPADLPAANGLGWIPRQLRRWHKAGTAVGHRGVLYDNRDRGHSSFPASPFPQLSRVVYPEAAVARGLDLAWQELFLHQGIVVGNSSTANIHPVFWRSQARAALTAPDGPRRLHAQYRANHLYVYVEHTDHDPGHDGEGGGHGDLFPANTPYVLVAQGSSGADQPFLEAVLATLAAFPPETRDRLEAEGLLMPSVQRLFRLAAVGGDREAYLGGRAHPSVFDAAALRPRTMVELAHGLAPDDLPPLASLRVVEEEDGGLRFGYGSERLFDTPCAVARVFRSATPSRRLVLSALDSTDPLGAPLSYHWRILRGDPEKISIRPQRADGAIVEIEIDHHGRLPTEPGSPIESTRVDIGLFVESGDRLSAPAFFTTLFLENETRVHGPGGRLESIDFTDPETRYRYVDPLIDPAKAWRDVFQYDETGRLTGWTRHRESGAVEEFDPAGRLVLARSVIGRPTAVREVRYSVRPDRTGQTRAWVEQIPTLRSP